MYMLMHCTRFLCLGDPQRAAQVRGRHPLVEAVGGGKHGFVPNSTEIGVEDQASVDFHNLRGL